MKARRGPRPPRDEEAERQRIEQREVEQWVDEGSVRAAASAAAERGRGSTSHGERSSSREVDPSVVHQIHDAVGSQRGRRLVDRLGEANDALDRDRLDEARRIVTPLVKELPHVAAVHETAGLVHYRSGRWKQAVAELTLARDLHEDPSLLPVLADAYRAQRRWRDVEQVWSDLKARSPRHEIMTEGRIVMAGALADQGDLRGAIELLTSASNPPKRVRPHHVRQWYVLGDLHDRAGDVVEAARWFERVAAVDPDFVDVVDRLRSLGR